jgi:cell wall-associated NlpC family hydrolase
VHRPVRLVLAVVIAVLSVLVAALAAPASAATATVAHPAGRFNGALQHRNGTVYVSGDAFDHRHPSRSIAVCIAAGGKCLRRVNANKPSGSYNRARHITGRHAFQAHVPNLRPGVTLTLSGFTNGHLTKLDRVNVKSPGDRLIAVAKRFVGHARYSEGGASPQQGFDCSGYTRWVYAHAGVAALPHNAEAQRHVRYMHRIPRSQARPGDLVFYFSGGPAYHVAIYAGHGMQYAAATPQDGIRYQAVWSSEVEYRTDWH